MWLKPHPDTNLSLSRGLACSRMTFRNDSYQGGPSGLPQKHFRKAFRRGFRQPSIRLFWSAKILWERLQNYISSLARRLLIRVGRRLRQGAFQHVIAFLSGSLPLTLLHDSSEFVRHTVNYLSFERKFGSVELSFLEEVIKESAAIIIFVAKPRDETSDLTLIFNRDLDELAVLEEGVRARIIFGGLGLLASFRWQRDRRTQDQNKWENLHSA